MQKRLHKNSRFLVLFAEKIKGVIPSYVSFAYITCIIDAVVLERN